MWAKRFSRKKWKILRSRVQIIFHPHESVVFFMMLSCSAAKTGKFFQSLMQVWLRFKNVQGINRKSAEWKKRQCNFNADGTKIEKSFTAES